MTTDLNTATSTQDAQGRWYELLSPTQVLTDENQLSLPQAKKTSHGNRKSQQQQQQTTTRNIAIT